MADAALDAQASRGPDGRGVMVVDGEDGVSAAIGHLRLAVIDPRAASDQPLHSDDGRSSLIFNGEIYNYKELRATLAPRPMLERALGRLRRAARPASTTRGPAFLAAAPRNRMWSLFYHSARSNSVLISRDRFGIKPIFVYHAPGDLLIVSSEIKGILAILGRTPPVEPEAIAEYLLRGRTNRRASTFYQGIKPFDGGVLGRDFDQRRGPRRGRRRPARSGSCPVRPPRAVRLQRKRSASSSWTPCGST